MRYLVIGGYAVIAHGYVRATKDIDLWLAVEPANAQRVAEVIHDFFGTGPEPQVFLTPGTIFRMGVQPNRIELFTDVLGVDFDACYTRRIEATLDDVTLPVLSLVDLRSSKAASARSQDLADLDNLPEA